MAVGFPLWLLVTFFLVASLWFAILPLPDIGPVELQLPSASQTGVIRAAAILFFVVYPVVFLWAYRISRQPWVVFVSMLLPVLAFCYAVACFPITDSNAEERAWLTYLGSLALVLAAGTTAALVAERHQPVTRQASA